MTPASSLDEQELHLPVWPAGQAEGGRQLRHQGLLPGDIQREGNFSLSSLMKVKQTLCCHFKASCQELSDYGSLKKLKQTRHCYFKASFLPLRSLFTVFFNTFKHWKQTLYCFFKASNQDTVYSETWKRLQYVVQRVHVHVQRSFDKVTHALNGPFKAYQYHLDILREGKFSQLFPKFPAVWI